MRFTATTWGSCRNGDGTEARGLDQRIEHCRIHHNGSFEEPGYNHNLYLGGTSVVLRFCEVHHSLTGHNVKSRAHHTRVEYCYIHDSANREFDLVDAADTERPESHAVILGCIVVKDPQSKGNKTVLHFGQDGGREHDGTVTLAFNTIRRRSFRRWSNCRLRRPMPGWSAILLLTAAYARRSRTILKVRNGASPENGSGEWNLFGGDFHVLPEAEFDPKKNLFRRSEGPLFVDPDEHDYRLRPDVARSLAIDTGRVKLQLPDFPGGDADTSQGRWSGNTSIRPQARLGDLPRQSHLGRTEAARVQATANSRGGMQCCATSAEFFPF